MKVENLNSQIDIPAGSFTIEIWHETLGQQSKQVEVKADDTININLKFNFRNSQNYRFLKKFETKVGPLRFFLLLDHIFCKYPRTTQT